MAHFVERNVCCIVYMVFVYKRVCVKFDISKYFNKIKIKIFCFVFSENVC